MKIDPAPSQVYGARVDFGSINTAAADQGVRKRVVPVHERRTHARTHTHMSTLGTDVVSLITPRQGACVDEHDGINCYLHHAVGVNVVLMPPPGVVRESFAQPGPSLVHVPAQIWRRLDTGSFWWVTGRCRYAVGQSFCRERRLVSFVHARKVERGLPRHTKAIA